MKIIAMFAGELVTVLENVPSDIGQDVIDILNKKYNEDFIDNDPSYFKLAPNDERILN